MIQRIRSSLTYKLFISILSVVIMMLFIMTIITYFITKSHLSSLFMKQGEMVLEGLNYSIEAQLTNNNIPAIQRILSNFGSSEDVRSIFLVNRERVILAAAEPSFTGKSLDNDLITKVFDTERRIMMYTTQNGDRVLLLIQPIRGKEYSIKLHSDITGVLYMVMNTGVISEGITKELFSYLLFIIIFTVCLFLFIILISTKLLIRPIKLIEQYTSLISKGDFDATIPDISSDEIGDLARHLNKMTKDIKELTKNIIIEKEKQIISRQAGMAEVATSVIHNIGNVLNSISLSVDLVKENFLKSDADNLSKVSTLLHQSTDHNSDLNTNQKIKLLPSYIDELDKNWKIEKSKNIKELESLAVGLQHVKQIIEMQQSLAGSYKIIESVNLSELIEAALKLSLVDLGSVKVIVNRQYDEIKPVNTDKAKILQILINLIKNAYHALLESSSDEKILTLSLKHSAENTIQIKVMDNGVGIASDQITKIFSYGYSTRKDGHGFGLHTSALSANELKGTLSAESEGSGKGATFILTLPG